MTSRKGRRWLESLFPVLGIVLLLASPSAAPVSYLSTPSLPPPLRATFEPSPGFSPTGPGSIGPAIGASPVDHWSPVLPTGLPGARDQAAMTFDPSDNATILFGGYNASTGRAQNDTWIYFQGVWTNISFALSRAPSPRWGAAMTFDALDNETVLFGGRNSTQYFGETWTFSAVGWVLLSPAKSPSPRVAEITDDVRAGDVVLFGGTYQALSPTTGPLVGYNDTWFFRGGAWFNVTVSSGPGPAANGNVVYDPLDHYVFLVGPGPSAGHAWVLTKGKWHGILSAGAPGATILNGTFAWDAPGLFLLLFGSLGAAAPLNQTWTYRAGVWTNLTSNLTLAPPIRANASIDFDRGAGGVLVLDGNPPRGGGTDRSDLWEFHGVPYRVNLSATPPVTDVEHPVLLQDALTETGGPGFVYGYSYGPLPPGCVSANASSLACDPTASGDYLVNTTVNRSDGTSIRAAIDLLVHPLPMVQLIAPVISSDPGVGLSFSASISAGTGPYQTFWNLGDNASSNSTSLVHAYAKSGVYPVNVTVTDAVGSIAEYGIVVTINHNLTVSTGANRTASDVASSIAFHSVPAGGTAPYTVQWTFGDGATGSGPNITYAFPLSGNFTVNATVTDAVGASRLASIPVVVSARPQVAIVVNESVTDVAIPTTFGVGLVGGVGPFVFRWNFSDGGSANGSRVTHAFLGAGPAEASVWVTDGNGVSTRNTTTLLVSADPTVTAQTVRVQGCGGASQVNFLAQGSAGVSPYSYEWAFGDGSPNSTGPNATHRFASAGPFEVTVRLSDAAGSTATASLTYSGLPCTGTPGSSGGLGGVPAWSWGLLVLAALAVVLALFGIRRRRPPAVSTAPTAATGPAPPVDPPPAPPVWQE